MSAFESLAAPLSEQARAIPRNPRMPIQRISDRIERLPLLPALLAEVIAFDLFRLPEALNFDAFAFGDSGGNFTAQYLMARGLRPTIDFGYQYGLLGLLVGRVWFAVAGFTPYAYVAANFALGLLIAWALARTAHALNVGAAGKLLIIAALGHAMLPSYPNFAHVLEATLLTWAIAEQARGARGNALALAAIASLAKPSMAYLYGAILIVMSAAGLDQDRFGAGKLSWPRMVSRGAIVWAAGAVLLAAVYGLRPMVNTALPLQGLQAYRALHFGFFTGEGRFFWHPPGVRIGYYLGTVAGFWIIATAYLLGYGAGAVPAMMRRSEVGWSWAAEIAVTCAVMQVAFVTLFFGGPFSYFYYPYLLVIGAAAVADRSRFARAAAMVLCISAILGYRSIIAGAERTWLTYTRSAETASLWAPPEERVEWTRALDFPKTRRLTLLAAWGDADLMFPQFAPPVSLYLVPGLSEESEVRRKAAQLSRASLVVVPEMPVWGGAPPFPQIQQALDSFSVLYSGHFFRVLATRDSVAGPTLAPRAH